MRKAAMVECRHKGLKIPRSKIRTGSSPVSGTNNFLGLMVAIVIPSPLSVPLVQQEEHHPFKMGVRSSNLRRHTNLTCHV